MDVVIRGQGCHRFAPLGKDLRRAPGIGTAQDRAAEMVQDYRRLGEIRGQRRYLTQLGMVNPGIESESEAGQRLIAFTELILREHPWTRHGLAHTLIRVPGRRKTDGTEAPPAGSEMRLQNRLHA